jgi:RNA polymerase sigma factor (sigma-70 family)
MGENAGAEALREAMSRLASGDRDAARTVFDLLWPRLHAFCWRALGDATQADDAAQRTLVRLFQGASAYDGKRDPFAWGLEIALWECRTDLRRRFRSKEAEWGDARLERIADVAASPESAVEQRELRAAVEAVLSALSPNERDTLRSMLSETVPSIPSTTWRKRKERALKRFRAVWRNIYGD